MKTLLLSLQVKADSELRFLKVVFACRLLRCGLVVDTWPPDQEVPGSSPGCARSTYSSWENLFTCVSSPHSCVKRVPDYWQYVTGHL